MSLYFGSSFLLYSKFLRLFFYSLFQFPPKSVDMTFLAGCHIFIFLTESSKAYFLIIQSPLLLI